MFALALAASAAFMLPAADAPLEAHVQQQLEKRFGDEASQTAADLETLVAPTGRVTGCRVVTYSGSREVAQSICKAVFGRKSQPARGFDGDPTYGLTRWTVGSMSDASKPQLALMVNQLPAADDGSVITSFPLNLAIGRDGAVERCESAEDRPEAYVEAACQQVRAQEFTVITNDYGTPVSYVRGYDVKFELSPDAA